MHPAIRSGNVALITGAGFGGIGYALAETFASKGVKLALLDNSSDSLKEAISSLSSGTISRDDVLGIEADVSKFEDMKSAAKQIKQKFGKLNIVCLNAGLGVQDTSCTNGNMEGWQKTLGTNLFGVINGSNAFVQQVIDTNEPGLVIVTGSKQGITAPPGNPSYNVSKAGVKTFTEALSHQLREETDKRVTAHLMIPGWTFTKLTRGRGVTEKPAGAWTPQQVVDYTLPRVANGDFYIVCPDNDVTSEMDHARMQWSATDPVANRSALSRWDKAYKDEFEKFMKEKLGQ